MASMGVLDLLEQRFLAATPNALVSRPASCEIETDVERQNLLDAYGEAVCIPYLGGWNLW